MWTFSHMWLFPHNPGVFAMPEKTITFAQPNDSSGLQPDSWEFESSAGDVWDFSPAAILIDPEPFDACYQLTIDLPESHNFVRSRAEQGGVFSAWSAVKNVEIIEPVYQPVPEPGANISFAAMAVTLAIFARLRR